MPGLGLNLQKLALSTTQVGMVNCIEQQKERMYDTGSAGQAAVPGRAEATP